MKREQLIEASYGIVTSYKLLENMGKTETMIDVMEGMGYTAERVVKAIQFMQDNLTPEDLNVEVEKTAYITYMNAVDKIERLMQMAEGYQEMGEVNLTIAEEDHHLEEEGEKKINEMVTKTGEDNATA